MSFIYVPAQAAPAISIGTPVDTTSGTSVTFTGIPSTSKIVYVNMVGVSLSAGDYFYVRIGTSTAISATGYTVSQCTAGPGAGVSTGSSTNEAGWYVIYNSGTILTATFTIILENSTTNTYSATYNAGDNGNRTFNGAGSKSLASPLSQLRITTYNGTATFTAGSINIAYI